MSTIKRSIETGPKSVYFRYDRSHDQEDTVSRLIEKLATQKRFIEDVYDRMKSLENRLNEIQYFADNADEFERSIKESAHQQEIMRLLTAENAALRKWHGSTADLSQRLQVLTIENENLREALTSNASLVELENLRDTLRAANMLIMHLKNKHGD